MKSLGKFEQEISNGVKVGGNIGIEGSNVKIQVQATGEIPIEKIVEPAMKVVDGLVDKLEAMIPGDQKELAAKAKADARKALVAAFSEEQPAISNGDEA